jgi:hypothetical protein
MALDRTWYNTLVDDDGSGMTGSVWDKADVDALMDAIDAEVGSTDGAWTPTLVGSGGGTPIYSTQLGAYGYAAGLVVVGCRITLTSKGSLAGSLSISGLPYSNPGYYFPMSVGLFNGMAANGSVPAGYLGSGTAITLTLQYGQTSMAPLDASHVADNFDIIIGGTYRI